MPRRNFSTSNNSYTRVPPPPRAPISSLPPQGAPKSNLLGNAASVAAGVAVGNVAGNIATNALFGSGESAQSLRREEQTVSTQTSSNELQVQDNLELSWLRCLRDRF